MAIFSFLKAKKENYAVALDIGTEFVKALIFKIEEDKGIVLGVGRQRQRLSDMQGGAVTDIQGVISNSEKALSEAKKQAKLAPTQTIIGIAGELVKGATTYVRYQRDNPNEKIVYSELKEIVEKVQEKATEAAKNQLCWETGYREIDVRLVNAALVSVRIDGHKVTNPLGFQGKEVEVGIFNAFAPIVNLSALQTIADSLGLDLLSIAAEPYAVARSIGLEEKPDFSAIFMDVGGGTTDIAIVRNGGVEGTKMFAIGGRAFTKRISEALKMPFEEAEELKIKYAKNKVPAKMKEKIKEILKNDAEVWLSGVELTLSEFPFELLPSKILLCGGGSELPEVQDSLSQSSWRKNLPFGREPEIRFMGPKDVINIIDQTGELKDPADVTPMALANLGLDLVGPGPFLSEILEKVSKALRT